MAELTEHGQAALAAICERHGVTEQTVRALMEAIVRGGGTQAQFDIGELGGMGQWSRGGMTMVGDMFNSGLQARVSALCDDIAQAGGSAALFKPARAAQAMASGQYQSQGQSHGQSQGQSMGLGGGMAMGRGQEMVMGFGWWPEDLGHPSAQGRQNDLAYAVFPQKQRLAVMLAGRITLYDTGRHEIGGVSQDNGGWRFTSQFGEVDLSKLEVVAGDGPELRAPEHPERDRDPVTKPAEDDRLVVPPEDGDPGVTPHGAGTRIAPGEPDPSPVNTPVGTPAEVPQVEGPARTAHEILATLERLGKLRELGILTEDEFRDKKGELLARL
ncbi:SHOCT domain-containing protein [Sagittula salina]|uniref:SHOCT domain-containing protein n=1 Tax=Sagittula salina TaxID=2820268 RepID=A0A940MS14_9RHOB|nr:SHOCT domain-containing protein [Sagittula salina]MBP0484344.1 SHOCT domain-containing protein [Sagittula salina]